MGRGERGEQATIYRVRVVERNRPSDLPLLVDSYPSELAAEVRQAVTTVLSSEPIAPKAVFEPQPGLRPLPETAPTIIGLSGYPRSGKDVAANYLIETYASVAKVNFSDPIIDEVNSFLSPHGHQINESNKSQPMYRALLQSWGTARRVEDEGYWVDSLRARVRDLSVDNRLVLVCGLRALSDAALVEELGGQHWRVVRPGNDYQAEHAIERQLDDLSDDEVVVVENGDEGNLASYQSNIDEALLS